MTGIGPVAVRCPRVRDRVDEGSERIRFSSAILPPYARRSKSLEVLVASSVEKLFLYAVDDAFFGRPAKILRNRSMIGVSAAKMTMSLYIAE